MRKGFTLIELLVVIAIIAILAVVVVLTLSPAELLRQGRDSNRLSDLATLTSAINLYSTDQGGASGYSLGTPNVTYLSIPDPTATTTAGTDCSGIGFPSGGAFHCAASSTYRDVNGTGWIPINFSAISSGSPLSSLPVDPTNTSSSNLYYTYQTNGTTFELRAVPESQKYAAQAGANPNMFIAGSNSLIDGGDWVLVPSNATFGTNNFYVIKYDAACSDGNGIPALPFCHAELRVVKSKPERYPKELNSLGDHIRSRRMDVSLLQKQVAEQIGVCELTITNWERNESRPAVKCIPAIIRFLGYDPSAQATSFPEQLRAARRAGGLTQKELAREFGVDPTTLYARKINVRLGGVKISYAVVRSAGR